MKNKINIEGQRCALLIVRCLTIARVANMADALPERPADGAPLRDFIPGMWPTVGDVRAIRDEMKRLGWKG